MSDDDDALMFCADGEQEQELESLGPDEGDDELAAEKKNQMKKSLYNRIQE